MKHMKPAGHELYECPVCGELLIWDSYLPKDGTVMVMGHFNMKRKRECLGASIPIPADPEYGQKRLV